MLHSALLFLHLVGTVAWLGGMFFAYFCLRPAAAETLDPPRRVPLWVAAFSRFLPAAALAVLLILGSGLSMLWRVGMTDATMGWKVMLVLGLAMSAVFVHVYVNLFPRLREKAAAADWPAAARALDAIRRLVALNLVLGVLVVAAAASAR